MLGQGLQTQSAVPEYPGSGPQESCELEKPPLCPSDILSCAIDVLFLSFLFRLPHVCPRGLLPLCSHAPTPATLGSALPTLFPRGGRRKQLSSPTGSRSSLRTPVSTARPGPGSRDCSHPRPLFSSALSEAVTLGTPHRDSPSLPAPLGSSVKLPSVLTRT